jgi:hypothetical protein
VCVRARVCLCICVHVYALTSCVEVDGDVGMCAETKVYVFFKQISALVIWLVYLHLINCYQLEVLYCATYFVPYLLTL